MVKIIDVSNEGKGGGIFTRILNVRIFPYYSMDQWIIEKICRFWSIEKVDGTRNCTKFINIGSIQCYFELFMVERFCKIMLSIEAK